MKRIRFRNQLVTASINSEVGLTFVLYIRRVFLSMIGLWGPPAKVGGPHGRTFLGDNLARLQTDEKVELDGPLVVFGHEQGQVVGVDHSVGVEGFDENSFVDIIGGSTAVALNFHINRPTPIGVVEKDGDRSLAESLGVTLTVDFIQRKLALIDNSPFIDAAEAGDINHEVFDRAVTETLARGIVVDFFH